MQVDLIKNQNTPHRKLLTKLIFCPCKDKKNGGLSPLLADKADYQVTSKRWKPNIYIHAKGSSTSKPKSKSILWKLCPGEDVGGGLIAALLPLNSYQKQLNSTNMSITQKLDQNVLIASATKPWGCHHSINNYQAHNFWHKHPKQSKFGFTIESETPVESVAEVNTNQKDPINSKNNLNS